MARPVDAAMPRFSGVLSFSLPCHRAHHGEGHRFLLLCLLLLAPAAARVICENFLPVTCDACKQDFCKDHFSYTAHECPFAFKKDVQVPVCPLCDVPIPVRRGETPDVAVGEHIDRDCAPRPGRGEKVFTYRCSKEGCKKKEMLQLACVQCHGNFCIQHRHPLDHSCRAASCSAGKARWKVKQ